MAQRHTSVAACLLLAASAAFSAGCTTAFEPGPARAASGERAVPAGQRFLALRVSGLTSGNGSVYLVQSDGAAEQAMLISHCRTVEIDRARPEGLLLPVHCDGQRITVHNNAGRILVRRGERL